MDNIITDYIKFTENFLYSYYRILLGNKYEKKLVSPFISKYIDVRYYNNTIFRNESNMINKINKELNLVAKAMISENKNKEETIKNSFALFGYILYLDDVLELPNLAKLYSALFSDKTVKLEYEETQIEEAKDLIKKYVEKKKDLVKTLETNEFEIKYTKIKKNLYMAELEHHVNISSIFSKEAIDKAYASKAVLGNKCHALYYLLTFQVLKDIINQEFNRKYMVEFPVELFEKTKKVNRFLKVLDNDILKEKIHLRYRYETYINNRNIIDGLMKNGFSIACDLDETFTNDFNQLVLFSYIFVYDKYYYFDTIMESKERIKTNIIVG